MLLPLLALVDGSRFLGRRGGVDGRFLIDTLLNATGGASGSPSQARTYEPQSPHSFRAPIDSSASERRNTAASPSSYFFGRRTEADSAPAWSLSGGGRRAVPVARTHAGGTQWGWRMAQGREEPMAGRGVVGPLWRECRHRIAGGGRWGGT